MDVMLIKYVVELTLCIGSAAFVAYFIAKFIFLGLKQQNTLDKYFKLRYLEEEDEV